LFVVAKMNKNSQHGSSLETLLDLTSDDLGITSRIFLELFKNYVDSEAVALVAVTLQALQNIVTRN